MKKINYIFIFVFYFTLSSLSAEINYFQKGKNLFTEKKYDQAKFKFEQDLVFNPKNENSYLYLAKIFKLKNKFYKLYRGMGSIGAMSSGSSERYFQKNYKDKSKFVPEGVESRVLYKGPVKKIIYQLQGGLRSSMGYIGAQKLEDIQKKSKFIKITKAGFYESMVHSVEAIKNTTNFKL